MGILDSILSWIEWVKHRTKLKIPLEEYSIERLTSKLRLVLEKHQAITQDGYVLEIHRIPGHGPSVLLQHGLLCTSASWLIAGRYSLAFLLNRAGYDVWMGNLRGNQYCRNHVNLDPSDPEFWEFTFHHHGVYDLPAIIGKIKDVTCGRELVYVGHSMGTTSLFVMASQASTYVGHISLAILLAPVWQGAEMKSNLRFLAPVVANLKPKIFSAMGLYEFPFRVPGVTLLKFLEENHPMMPSFIQWFFSAMGECKDGALGRDEILKHLPSTTSIYVLLHFSQNITDKTFKSYDWKCIDKNKEVYGKPGTPEYTLEKLICPTAIFYSEEDFLAAHEEVTILENILPNLVFKKKVSMSHLDFIFAGASKFLVNNRIDQLIQEFTIAKVN